MNDDDSGRIVEKNVWRDKSFDKKLGNKLRMARMHAGYTQTQLAELFGVSIQQVQKYERGINRISVQYLFHFAKTCDKPLFWFLDGLEDRKEDTIYQYLTTHHGYSRILTHLSTYFVSIRNRKIRRKIYELIKALSHE